MENTFEVIGIKHSLIEGLKKGGITVPTRIQERVIPLALENKDIIAQSETGTGKTLAYLLPIFQKIDTNKREMQVVILSPTHELAIQIHKEINILATNSNIPVTSISIIGEVNKIRQIEKLREKPHIIVGSAGRILELIKMRKLSAHTIKTIVVDEADRLLDKYNIETTKAVIKTTLKERQLMLFSASISPQTIEATTGVMKEPIIIKLQVESEVNPDINHYYIVCEQREKIEILRKLVHAVKPKRTIVFIKKSDEVEITTSKLKYHKLLAEGLHGTFIKEDRKKAMEDFRLGKIQILVASDLAARGLDIQGVTHIFNLDIPENSKDYLHRVGRTGRMGKSGLAISIAVERELELIKTYEKDFNIEIVQKDIYMGRIIDPKDAPKAKRAERIQNQIANANKFNKNK